MQRIPGHRQHQIADGKHGVLDHPRRAGQQKEGVGEQISRPQQHDQQGHRQQQPCGDAQRPGRLLAPVGCLAAIGALPGRPDSVVLAAQAIRSLVRFQRGHGGAMCAIAEIIGSQDIPTRARWFNLARFLTVSQEATQARCRGPALWPAGLDSGIQLREAKTRRRPCRQPSWRWRASGAGPWATAQRPWPSG